MSAEFYRTGLVGCGSRGRHFFDSYFKQCERAGIVAVADVVEENLTYFREAGVETFSSAGEMVAHSNLDLVLVIVNPAWHASVMREMFEKEVPLKGIYLEKPMTTHLGEADEIVEVCERRGIKLVVGHQLRYTPGWSDPRHLIDTGAIGKVHFMRAVRHGPPILTHHTHQTNLMMYYLNDDPILWVLGQIHRKQDHKSEGINAEEQALGFLQFQSGTVGIIEAGKYEPAAPGQIFIAGEAGDIRVLGGKTSYRNEKTGGAWLAFSQTDYPDIFNDWIAWIEGGPEHRCSYRNGHATLEALLAIYESSRSRQRIDLPMKERGNALEEMIRAGDLMTCQM
ncbi:MAG: Gfo/Idh/MocA family oxidoreductase [Planctomycetota bacterium]|nr:Gfo/Idh/MocA family oxidoreductase [Planctomycetota bacterium]MDA1139977.1 Gfo/Idh/MocA family oxidoreductase [Planctomycetota bacterium]